MAWCCGGIMCRGARCREEAWAIFPSYLGIVVDGPGYATSRNSMEGLFPMVINGEDGMASIGPAGMTTDVDVVVAVPPKKDPNAETA